MKKSGSGPIPPRRARFAEEYVIDFSATDAATRAGYATKYASRAGWVLLQDPRVQDAVREQIRARIERTQITQDQVLRALAAIVFFDPRKLFDADGRPKPISDLDDYTAAAISGVEVQETLGGENVTVRVKKYRVVDKNPALGNAMKHLGMLKENILVNGGDKPVEVSVQHSVTESLLDAIKARLRARR